MSARRSGLGLMLAAVAVAFALMFLPWPDPLSWLKPYWPALALLYFAIERPERIGPETAFLIGLGGDLLYGTVLGEQALRLAVAVFIAQRFRARLRFFPMAQQSLAVGAILLNDRFLTFLVRVASGEALPPAAFWVAPLTGALLWPWCFLALDVLAQRGRRVA